MYSKPKENTGEDNKYGESELHTAEGLMNRDAPLTPLMISKLMHVDATLTNVSTHELREEEREATHSPLYVLGVVALSVIIAVTLGASLMFLHELGPFHESSFEASVR